MSKEPDVQGSDTTKMLNDTEAGQVIKALHWYDRVCSKN